MFAVLNIALYATEILVLRFPVYFQRGMFEIQSEPRGKRHDQEVDLQAPRWQFNVLAKTVET